MPDVATAPAPSTGAVPTPVAAPESPATPQVETTLDPQVERGQAPADATTAEPQTPETPPAAPKPKLADLLKDPDYARDYEGITGERIRRERAAAAAEAEQKRQQADHQRFLDSERQQIEAETRLRQAEEAERARLRQAGDPYDFYAYDTKVTERRAAFDREWGEKQAQRQAAFAVQQQIEQSVIGIKTEQKERLDIYFRSLPIEVQREVGGKDYYGGLDDVLADWKGAYERHLTAKHQSDMETRVQAEVKKALGRMNLNAEDFDLGGGIPVSGSNYRYMEDVEAAFRKGDLKTPEYREWRAKGLPYRRGR